MTWYVKSEYFTKKTLELPIPIRKEYLNRHKEWILELKDKGIDIMSGYLVDSNKNPGGGGLLLLKAKSFQEAKSLIINDPMIINKLVHWTMHELVIITNQIGNRNEFILDDFSSDF